MNQSSLEMDIVLCQRQYHKTVFSKYINMNSKNVPDKFPQL